MVRFEVRVGLSEGLGNRFNEINLLSFCVYLKQVRENKDFLKLNNKK